MGFSTNDLLQKREHDRLVTWISERLLLAKCTELTSEYLRKACRSRYKETMPSKYHTKKFLPDNGRSWRWGKANGMFYYDYDRITEHYRMLMPSLDALRAQIGAKSEYDTLIERALGKVYKDYLHCYPGYNDEKTTALAKAAAVIQVAVEWIKENDYNTKKMSFFVELAEAARDVSYLPGHYRVMKAKILEVLTGSKAITEIIDLPRVGNSNAKKYEDGEVMAWLLQMRNMPQNYTNSHIVRKLRTLCELSAKPVPSASWFNLELARPFTKFLTAEGRFGKNGRRGAAYAGYIPIENAMFAGDCWQGDGTRVNLIGHKGKDGKQEFLYIIAIRDVYSGDVLGFHLDTKEDRWGWICALKMAVAMTGYTPWEFVIDRFPGHNTPEWGIVQRRMEREGTKVTITSAATGKARIERMFGTMQTVFMQDSDYYYGEGVQSRRDYAHRSEEYLGHMQKKAKREGWDFDEAWKEATRIIEAYRSTSLSYYSRKYANVQQSPRELHQQCEKPHVGKLDPWTFVELFGLEKRVTLRAKGLIKTEIQRVPYHYTVENYETISHYKEVAICYDMDDLNTVYLFEATNEANRKYLGEAVEQRAAQMYGPKADKSGIGAAKKRLKQIEDRRKADLEKITSGGDEVALLLGSYSSKPDTASAENAWLNERTGEWQDRGTPRVTTEIPDDDEENEVVVDVRRMY